jgi:hypothetical protein
MEPRRFTILYQRQRDVTLEREINGSLEDVLRAAWDMLQSGDAKVAAIVEPGNLEFHVWHNRIVHWGRQYGARDNKASVHPAAQPAAPTGPVKPTPVQHRPAAQRPAA